MHKRKKKKNPPTNSRNGKTRHGHYSSLLIPWRLSSCKAICMQQNLQPVQYLKQRNSGCSFLRTQNFIQMRKWFLTEKTNPEIDISAGLRNQK